jgi:chromosomal replication initiator protein
VGREFDRWFGSLSAHATKDGEIIINSPNAIHQLWIEGNYQTFLHDAVSRVFNGPRTIVFGVTTLKPITPATEADATLQAARRQGVVSAEVPVITERQPMPSTLSDAGICGRFSFENFITGPSNNYSAAVARAVAEKPGRTYNPLFLHSEPGLGKTHLLHAIGREIMFRKRRVNVRYVTSEMFTNEFMEAIRKQTFSQFRQKFRKADVLLIDDVQFFAGKESTQEEFFHTFNDLFHGTKQIVLASDKPPSEIDGLEARLVSRFGWGLTAQLLPPDFETRVAILRNKMIEDGAKIDDWILEYIAQRVRSDVRKLEGSIMRIGSRTSLIGDRKLTEGEVEEMLRDVIDQDPARSVNIDRIQRVVCEQYDIRMSELLGRGRPKMVAEARQVAMYLTRTMAKLPLVEVGKAFGGRDHGTVIHAVKVVEARMEQYVDFNTMIIELRMKVSSPA